MNAISSSVPVALQCSVLLVRLPSEKCPDPVGGDENALGVVSGWASCIKSYQIEHEEQPAVVTLPCE